VSKTAQIVCLMIVLAVPVIAVGSVIVDPDPLFLIGWIVLALLAAIALGLVVVTDAAVHAGRDIFRGRPSDERRAAR
jgi:heme A synthase